MRLRFTLNGKKTSVDTPAERRVVDLLREDLGLTGTKEGCGSGECGACTILVDGSTRLSCLMLCAQLEGRDVVTIEGIGGKDGLSPLQHAFVEHGAVQCGYCTPGMVITATDLLKRHARPGRKEIREGISGNLCRCTGYQKIVDAIEAAADEREGDASS